MVMVSKLESNMTFVYDDKYGYRIEDILKVQGNKNKTIKDCDFTILNNGKIFLIEAKSSTPLPNKQGKKQSDAFKEYITEITDKINDSLFFISWLFFKITQ